MIHKSVLLHKTIELLDIKNGDVFVDGTLGNGGHSLEIIKRFEDRVKIIGIDTDDDAIARSTDRLKDFKKDMVFLKGNFRNIDEILKSAGIEKADKILLDIGMSSNQLEESNRGFSFNKNEPLNMSFSKEKPDGFDAYDIVNFWDEDSIRTIIRNYGEERFAGRIARGIIKTREMKPIENTEDLVSIIKSATPKAYHFGKIHPATRTFQAIRIAVNDELFALEEGISKGFTMLNSSGRFAIISFHSLEDRIVKNTFKVLEQTGFSRKITKKPIIADEEEIKENPRSRSAKLRIIEKI
jgi:16S rRNA (cytosine1402-N4)-methyltransferase